MKILFTLGIPDDLIGHVSLQQIQAGVAFPGNLPLIDALIAPLKARGWQAEYAYLGQPTEINVAGADVIVNCICDASRQQRSLGMLQELINKTGLPVSNTPAAMLASTRDRLSSYHDEEIRIPRTTRFAASSSTLEEHLHSQGHRLPVLIRPTGAHGGKGLVKLAGGQVATWQAAEDDYYVTDFIDFISPDGHYRKYRLIYAGGRLFRRHLMIGKEWLLDLASREYMSRHPELLAEEKAFIHGEGDVVADKLVRIFEHFGLDYGLVDYALDKNGLPIIFELNGCFQLTGSLTAEQRPLLGYLEANNPDITAAILENIAARVRTR